MTMLVVVLVCLLGSAVDVSFKEFKGLKMFSSTLFFSHEFIEGSAIFMSQ